MEVTHEHVAECCKMVRKGSCREIFVVCGSDEEASQLMGMVHAWKKTHEKENERPILCTRSANEVKIYK